MAMRDPLKPLVSRLRREIGDEDTSKLWTDAELADALDEFAGVVRYHPMQPIPTRTPQGTVLYLDFETGLCWWETDAQVVNGSWSPVSYQSLDWARGRVTFATHQVSALYISGRVYDFWRAVEGVLDQTIAKLKAKAIDRRDRDMDLKRNQQIQTLQDLKRSALAKQTPGYAPSVRHDT